MPFTIKMSMPIVSNGNHQTRCIDYNTHMVCQQIGNSLMKHTLS